MYAIYFLFQLSALAQAPASESTLTSWSCTVDTLLSGNDCVFEFKASSAPDVAELSTKNVRFVRELAPIACARAGRPADGRVADKLLLEICERDFSAAATSCALGSKAPLVDGQSRFAPSARGCYRALQDVMQRTMLMAAISSVCCQCMLSGQCSGTGMECYRDLAAGMPNASELACMRSACSDQCRDTVVSFNPPMSTNISKRKLR